MWVTGPLTSDGPAEAFGTATIVAALWYRSAPSWRRSLVVGALAGAAIGTKSLLAGPSILAAWLIVLGVRRFRHVVAVPFLALGVVIAAAVPWGLSAVYDQSVLYHLDKTGQRDPGANLRKVISTLTDRDIPLLLIAAVAHRFRIVHVADIQARKLATRCHIHEGTTRRSMGHHHVVRCRLQRRTLAGSDVAQSHRTRRRSVSAPRRLVRRGERTHPGVSSPRPLSIATPLWAVRLDGLLRPPIEPHGWHS